MTMTPLTCEDAAPLLARAADGALEPADHRALDAHLASCEACAATLAAHAQVRAALVARPATPARLGFDARVMRAVRREGSWFEHWNWRALTWGLAPVTAALLIAAATIVARQAPAAAAPAVTAAAATSSASGDTVATALSSDSVSDTSMLSLMLYANADDPMSAHAGRK